jgi:purine-binding chemotaxis protein CheW
MAVEENVAVEKTTCLLISIENTLCAINALNVREILELPALQYIKGLPLYVAGFVNVRGEIMVVLDLRVCLGESFQMHSLKDHLIIVEGEKYAFGLVTPEIRDLIQLDVSQVASEAVVKKIVPLFPFLSTIAKYQEQIVFLINSLALERYVFQEVPEVFKPSSLGALENKMTSLPMNPEEENIFHQRAKRLTEKVDVALPAEQVNLLTIIELKGEYFALETIRELSPLSDFTPIPYAPPYVFGFFNLRGHVLPIIDILQILQGKKNEVTPTSKVLIVDFDNTSVGVLVDDIVNLIFLNPADYRSVPISVKVISEKFIKNTIKYEKEMIPILDIGKILKSIQVQD